MNITKINFKNKEPGIFSDIAEEAAKYITEYSGEKNKNTQIRKFYDELVMWYEKVYLDRHHREEKFKELEPFIKMLKAKVAYAKGRKYVDDNFCNVFNRCIDQADSAESLRDAKLFMEAMMGYAKALERKK
ncbi:type III-A CRISPR-associated protein Csm2 [Basilea psittacipulmonis]|uniref:CRISPR system Cms protein Csm2 n=1 Tax=Basilea psittacipulmonis DSM 24701 TaxID=1072685 RepID=A0A077DE04_9BURK|nr:type III-A CRISPR-associated protein Csm2 [Basilea psittacipulmonis]AIL32874.1 CRISPR-associated protein Csm2 [Basilea psittacipulmonis DSM 24701]